MTVSALQISTDRTGAELTPQQKRFNTLIRQIQGLREQLSAWRVAIDRYRSVHARTFVPLEARLLEERRRWLFALDERSCDPARTQAELATLDELICDLAYYLLRQGPEEDAEVKALFARHSGLDLDEERRRDALDMKDMAESMTGMDLGDDEAFENDEDVLERIQRLMAQQAAEEEERRAARDARRRPSAAQKKREAEAQQATQSVRDIFRKLASALHPDRETDAAQRESKTALMQKVNQAYAANDLLTLLQLQMQIEQIDADHIANVSAQAMKHYVKVLSQQVQDLKQEVHRVELGFRAEFGMVPHTGTDPRSLAGYIVIRERELQAELQALQSDRQMLDNPKAFKRWLKQQRQLIG